MSSLNSGLLLHPRTKSQVDNFLNQPAHAVLLIGGVGSGKYSLAKEIAANMLSLENPQKLDNYPYYTELVVPEDKKEIPIEAVRAVIHEMRLKTPGKTGVQRIVVIEGAQRLSGSAQSSLLKTLEEPGADTAFILTAPSVRSMAPTIASRAQNINVYPVTRPAALAYYQDGNSEAAVASNWLLSAGAAGLLESLLKEDAEHPLKDAVAAFKEFLSSDTYHRLLYCDTLAKEKVKLAYFLDGGQRVLRVLHQSAVKNGNAKQARVLAKSRRFINQLQTQLDANGSPKLLATSLALNLKV